MMGHESRSNVFVGPNIGADAAVAAASATSELTAGTEGSSDEGKGADEITASLLGGSALATGSVEIFGYTSGLGDSIMCVLC